MASKASPQSDIEFQNLLTKYKHFLKQPTDREGLLRLGKNLFGEHSNDVIERPSYSLLKKKEKQLSIPKIKEDVKVKPQQHRDSTNFPNSSPSFKFSMGLAQESTNQELIHILDQNALLLSRRKKLENQRNQMLEDYGQLMEQSVQSKVQLKMDMQKLKEELNSQLSKSRAAVNKGPVVVEKNKSDKPIMEELKDLNSQVLMRIGSFKMALKEGTSDDKKAVLERYKPHMERILGEIYAYSDYMPAANVIANFSKKTDEIDHMIGDIRMQLESEHATNKQLQKEAAQLGEEVKEHEIQVGRLKQRNDQLKREITLLKTVAESEIEAMKSNFSLLLQDEDEEMGAPLSSRAKITCIEEKDIDKPKMKRSRSRKDLLSRENAVPVVPPVKTFVDIMRSVLLDKINHAQN